MRRMQAQSYRSILVMAPINKLVTVKLDPERIGTNRKHEIEFYIADKVGNTDFFQSSFYF